MATPPRYSHISVAIPLLAEKQNLLPLLSRFRCQTFSNFTLYLCVNNVENGYGYEENQESLHLLRSISDLPLSIIDRSSHGLGWTGKRKGVGWARKLLFDRISNEHDSNELIISLDADTVESLLRISAIGFETMMVPVTDGPMDIKMAEGTTTLDVGRADITLPNKKTGQELAYHSRKLRNLQPKNLANNNKKKRADCSLFL